MKTPCRDAPLLLIVAMVVGACHRSSSTFIAPPVQTIQGSGVIVEEDRQVFGFSRIDFRSAGSVSVQPGAREELRIRGDDNLLAYVTTDVQGGVLTMRTRTGFDLDETQPMEFTLTVVDLSRFDFTGVGNMQLSGLAVNNLFIGAAGVGSIQCSALNATFLDVDMSGIGSVNVSGQVEDQMVSVGHFGDYDATDLFSREATVTINSAGSATVRVSDRLEVNLLGTGSVFFIGDPVVVIHGSGSGRVQKIG